MSLQTHTYLYSSTQTTNPAQVLIVLPDIFGLNPTNIAMIDSLASDTGFQTFGLDYFYQITNQSTALDPQTEVKKAIELMQTMKGEDFMAIFTQTLDAILLQFPDTNEIAVVGFCFGGRLALLSGLSPKVGKIIDFYGGGTNQADFYQGNTVLDALAKSPETLQNQKYLALFGDLDESIPLSDREVIKDTILPLAQSYREITYPQAGHAFFNQGRANFVPEIYDEVVEVVKTFLK